MTINCEWCNSLKEKPNNRFCSIVCRNKFISSTNDYKKISEKLKKPDIKKICKQCNKEFSTKQKNKIFCCLSCSGTWNNLHRSKTVYEKHSKILKEKIQSGNLFLPKNIKEKIKIFCLKCNKEFYVIPSIANTRKYCSFNCYQKQIPIYDINSSYEYSLTEYRNLCQFKFSLNSYPEEFDFSLIQKIGWYSPSNKKNNLNGVSRDHMYSVKDGWINKIDPRIISHPANCRLIKHTENISKNYHSVITLEQLLSKIESWNKKYSF